MNNITVLTVYNEEENFDMYFSSIEKAQEFIKNNFEYDLPKKITNEYFEGVKCNYTINNWVVDQDRL